RGIRALARRARTTGPAHGTRRPEPGRLAQDLRARHRLVAQLPDRARTGRTAREAALRSGNSGRGRRLQARYALIPTRSLPAAGAAAQLSPELIAWSTRADAVLARVLPSADQPPQDLHQAMRYAVLGGGKR